MSDMHPELIDLMRRNLELNNLAEDGRCSVAHLDWDASDGGPSEFDVVIGADVVYPKEGLPASLAAAALGSLKRSPTARLYIMQHGSWLPARGGQAPVFSTRDGWSEFVQLLEAQGSVSIEGYSLHCRHDGDEDDTNGALEGPNYYVGGSAAVEFALLRFKWREETDGAAPIAPAMEEIKLEVRVQDRERLGAVESFWVVAATVAQVAEKLVAAGIPAQRQMLRIVKRGGGRAPLLEPARYYDAAVSADQQRSLSDYGVPASAEIWCRVLQEPLRTAPVVKPPRAAPAGQSNTPAHSVRVEGDSVVAVVELPGVATMASVELEMTPSEIIISAQPSDGDVLALRLPLPAAVDVDGVRAKFSKKKRTLTVRAPCS